MITNAIKYKILSAARDMVRNLRNTADRLDAAVRNEDMQSIAEIQLSATSWTLDALRGTARVFVLDRESE